MKDSRYPYAIDNKGYFTKNGSRIFPVGVNYWPASCGVNMWMEMPKEEIRKDLDDIKKNNLNCVRFFARWEDFEPDPESYDATALEHFDWFLRECNSRSLMVIPTLFVGWMSGGIFWPKWKSDRNLFSDTFMRERAFLFASRLAEALVGYDDILLLVDQSNEICCVPDCKECSPHNVESWCGAVSDAIRNHLPDVLIISGNEQAQVTSDSGWRLGNQPGCNLYSMHTYPNSTWHSISFDGMTDPLCQSLFPFYIKCARAFGPVMMEEFGTIFTKGAACDDYLRGILPSSWESGANGFLWWGLRDFKAKCHPYEKNAFEGPLGLLDENDHIKSNLSFFAEFCASLEHRKLPELSSEIALYWPKHFYDRENPYNPGNVPSELSRRMIIVHFTLSALGYDVGIVRGDLKLGQDPGIIVVTGAALTMSEIETLTDWVKCGGQLIWQGVDVTTCGDASNELMGADAADLFSPKAEGVKLFGDTWDFSHFARDVFVGVIPTTAEVIAADDRGRPVVFENTLGNGKVITCLSQPDDMFAEQSSDFSKRETWKRWYEGMIKLLKR